MQTGRQKTRGEKLAPKPFGLSAPPFFCCGAKPTERASDRQSRPAADAERVRYAGRMRAQQRRSREKRGEWDTTPTCYRIPSFHQPQIGSCNFLPSIFVAWFVATRRPACECSLRVFSRSFLTKVQKGQLFYYKTLVPFLSID